MAPPGLIEIKNEFIIEDSGLPDEVAPNAEQWSIDVLPDEALIYLIGSRYCEHRVDFRYFACSCWEALPAAERLSRRSATSADAAL